MQEATGHRKKYLSTYPLSNQDVFQKQTFQDQFPKRGQESYREFSKLLIVCNSTKELEDSMKGKKDECNKRVEKVCFKDDKDSI